MLNVLITIDTEVYPLRSDWKRTRLRGDLERDIFGCVDGREVGLRHQAQVLSDYGLKAVFMVESLFPSVPEIGIEPLAEIVEKIDKTGHEVQLHIHPEWVPYIQNLGVTNRGYLLTSYSRQEQEQLLRVGIGNLKAAGVKSVLAFRAGDYAANNDTLAALCGTGVRFDCSYNPVFAPGICQLPRPQSLGHVTEMSGVCEVPVAAFRDLPRHYRPAELAACSTREFIHALESAERAGWDCFVIVSHSFEMIRNRRHEKRRPAIRTRVEDRFRALCSYLSEHRDRYRVVGFSDLCTLGSKNHRDIRGRLANTTIRIAQQLLDRVLQ